MGHVGARGYLAYGRSREPSSSTPAWPPRPVSRIRVNAVAVGSTATSALDIVMSSDELRTQMEEATPLKRIGDPEDIAATVLFWPRRPGPSSQARSSRPTAACSRPTSNSVSPTSKPTEEECHELSRRAVEHRQRGRHALAGIDAHPELDLVGVFVSNPAKIGRDAGELAGLGRSSGERFQ